MSQIPPEVSPTEIQYYTPRRHPSMGYAVTAMVLGILSIVPGALIPGVGMLLGITATVFGLVAHRAINAGRARGVRMATVGICSGMTGVAIGVAVLLILFGAFGNDPFIRFGSRY